MTRSQPLPQRLFVALTLASAQGAEPARRWLSGAALAAEFGVSRSAISKAAAELRSLGLALESLPRQGYRLHRKLSALDAAAICAALPPEVRTRIRSGDCAWQTGSTNADLLARSGPPDGCLDFLAAEIQTEGRGRRGRRWLAAPGGGLCLSWSRSFEALPPHAGAMSLVIGVTALRALRRFGARDVQLKWPNDLVSHQGKLGGILIELRSDAAGPLHLVVGIGLNLLLEQGLAEDVSASGNRATDLAALGITADRNALIAALIDEGRRGLAQFEQEGFAPFAGEFASHDSLKDRAVRVVGSRDVEGVAEGVDADGALQLRTAQGVERIFSGDVSVRAA
ncbi:MAG: hypothetical protein RLZZ200_535 [Pseudomonadota bacterium]